MIIMVMMVMVVVMVMMMMVEFLKDCDKYGINDHLARYNDDQDEGRDCVEPQKPFHPHHDVTQAQPCWQMFF